MEVSDWPGSGRVSVSSGKMSQGGSHNSTRGMWDSSRPVLKSEWWFCATRIIFVQIEHPACLDIGDRQPNVRLSLF